MNSKIEIGDKTFWINWEEYIKSVNFYKRTEKWLPYLLSNAPEEEKKIVRKGISEDLTDLQILSLIK